MTGEDEASDLRKRLAIALHEVAGLEDQLKRATSEHAEMFQEYGQHKTNCPSYGGRAEDACSCGFRDACRKVFK